jgi:protein TonB
MPGPLLYKGPPRWQVWSALGGAVFIHLAAAVIAGIHKEEVPVDVSQIPEAVVQMEIQTEPQPPEPPPPPDEPEPPPPPPEPQEQPEFREENPTPPPKQRPQTNKPIAPIKAPKPQGVPAGPMSMSSAKAVAVSAPKPEYPYEARRSKITGSGVCVMTVDTASGAVTDASMSQSTGNPVLDNSAVAAFKRWRFKPGTVSKVRTPITYTLTGASY